MKKRLQKLCVILCGAVALTITGCGAADSGAYDRGMEALESGDYELALQELEEARELDDRVAEVSRAEGIIALAQGNADEAMRLFQEALDHVTGMNKAFIQDVNLYLAQAHLSKDEVSATEKICQDILEEGSCAEASLMMGRISLAEGDADAAKEYFAASTQESPSYENYLTIYDLYADVNMEADGAAILEKALTLAPANAADYCSLGQIYYNLGETEQAKTSFARAIDLGNTDAVPMMGKLYLEIGDTQAARSMYQSYLNETSRPALAYNGLALCDLAEKNYDAALANIGKGLAENDPEVRESLLFNEIAAYEYKLDFQTAKAKMQSFLAEYPDNKEAERENIFLQSR